MKSLQPSWTTLQTTKLCEAYIRFKTVIASPADRIRFDHWRLQ